MAIDIYHDPHRKTLRKLDKKIEFPKYVLKQDLDNPPKDKNHYADTIKKACPIDTPANTYLSFAYQMMAKGEDVIHREAMTRLVKAAAIHKIEDDLCELVDKLQQEPPKQEEEHILKEAKLFPITKWRENHDVFTQQHQLLPPQWREKVANWIVEHQEQPVAPVVLSYSKRAVCYAPILKEELEKRAQLALVKKKPQISIQLVHLADNIRPIERNTSFLTKIANTLTALDEIMGFVGNTFLQPPHEAVWNTPPEHICKLAEYMVNVNGKVYSVQDILQHRDALADIIGSDFLGVPEEEFSDVIETLPKDVLYLVGKYLEDQGLETYD